MHTYQQQFIEFALRSGVLRFGQFTLRSGRSSPYFFNLGALCSGRSMLRLGEFFAASIRHSEVSFDVLYGPAYKGIPLCCATSMALAKNNTKDMAFAYNRKEAKKYGEGGSVVGAQLSGDIAIIDDVITAGTAIRESLQLITQFHARVVAVFVAFDRQEVDESRKDRSAIMEIEQTWSIPVIPIVSFSEVIIYLKKSQPKLPQLDAMQRYYQQYGIVAHG